MHSDIKKRRSFLVLLFAIGDVRRVCRAWHLTSQMKVLIPGNRRAEG